MTQTSNRSCCPDLREVLTPELFKALCDPTRLSILARLAECCGELSVSDVAESCPIDISVVSRHLAQLKNAGILEAEKRGRTVYYSIRASFLVASLRAIADAIEGCCPPEGRTDDEE